MSNPEKKTIDVAEEITENSENNDSSCSIEDGEIREEVFALLALSVNQRSDVDEEIHKEAVIAVQLIVEAAKEAAEKKKTEQIVSVTGDISGSLVTKKAKRPRVLTDALTEASVLVEERERIKKRFSQLTNLPGSAPRCTISGKGLKSLNAVFGHVRVHKNRDGEGSLPFLTFYAVEEGFGGDIASSSSGVGLGIDLNVKLEEEEKESGSEFAWKFDLNKEPQDEADEGKEDKAE